MKRRFSLTRSARQDLQSIDGYHVREYGVPAADRLLNRIVEAIERYAEWPMSAPARPELASDLRGFNVASYMVYYAPQARSGIRVERIIHGARDQAALFTRHRQRKARERA
ncbi:MAG: hypothetical protein GEV06_06415 [Luteitalea sp.]|nr:hypothetical protein [Luteitalea sp.]